MMIAEFGFGATLLTIAGITVSLLLIALILLQKNRGAGLSGAFGGVGGHSAFGTKTGDFLTWLTVGLVVVFLVINVIGTFVYRPDRATAAQTTEAPAATDTTADTETAEEPTPEDGYQAPKPAEEEAPTAPAAPAPAE